MASFVQILPFVLFVACLLIGFAQPVVAREHVDSWHPVPDNAFFEVLFLQQPLWESSGLGKISGLLGGYHFGIGFREVTSKGAHVQSRANERATEFIAPHGYNVFDYIFPAQVTNPTTGRPDIAWVGADAFLLYNDIVTTKADDPNDHWTKFTRVNAFPVPGTIVNAFGENFIPAFNSEVSGGYLLWELWDYWRHDIAANSLTCKDAALTALQYLHFELGVQYDPNVQIKTDHVNVYGDFEKMTPEIVSMDDPKTHAEIVSFYGAFTPREDLADEESLIRWLVDVFEVYEGPAFTRARTADSFEPVYYRYHPTFPYATYHYASSVLPGQPGYEYPNQR
jgi:hypothetical protein|eukprot:gnl/Ergobibamus_cyprinoides/55.p2 GENE.gnl/Ergobibamus_cyprinoides/55~~gnl/Ergobibamus_cyprinoides/55.p2  ORF type:complete len:353 (+),score=99.93 gnl/Ergobibamus_cyprinoides/55:47-1060(+)